MGLTEMIITFATDFYGIIKEILMAQLSAIAVRKIFPPPQETENYAITFPKIYSSL